MQQQLVNHWLHVNIDYGQHHHEADNIMIIYKQEIKLVNIYI